jgi:hypothetical protein
VRYRFQVLAGKKCGALDQSLAFIGSDVCACRKLDFINWLLRGSASLLWVKSGKARAENNASGQHPEPDAHVIA